MICRIFFIFFFLFFFQKGSLISQYRDPFSEKTKGINFKKRNKRISKKTKNLFSSVKKNNGIYGLDHDPFKINKKKSMNLQALRKIASQQNIGKWHTAINTTSEN